MTDEEGSVAAPNDTVADDDSLYVLTAVLLTPAQFPSVLGDDYPAACAALAVEPYAEGYGLVLGQDGTGARWTVVVEDVSLVAVAIAAWDCGMEYDLSPDDRSVVCALPGWPLPVAVAAPGVAAPHDPLPDPEAEGISPAPLAPPDTEAWGPAQRRMGADEIAHQWTAWREQIDDATAFTTPVGKDPVGTGARTAPVGTGAEPGAEPGAGDESGPGPQPEVEVEVEGDVETGPETVDEPAADSIAGTNTEAETDTGAEAPAMDAPSGVHPGVRRDVRDVAAELVHGPGQPALVGGVARGQVRDLPG
ncbi:hypothetical protein, partial [Streptomyces sp. NPDC001880]